MWPAPISRATLDPYYARVERGLRVNRPPWTQVSKSGGLWAATLKGLLAYKLRLALTAAAVVLGVSFVTGTFVLTDTLTAFFDGVFKEKF